MRHHSFIGKVCFRNQQSGTLKAYTVAVLLVHDEGNYCTSKVVDKVHSAWKTRNGPSVKVISAQTQFSLLLLLSFILTSSGAIYFFFSLFFPPPPKNSNWLLAWWIAPSLQAAQSETTGNLLVKKYLVGDRNGTIISYLEDISDQSESIGSKLFLLSLPQPFKLAQLTRIP